MRLRATATLLFVVGALACSERGADSSGGMDGVGGSPSTGGMQSSSNTTGMGATGTGGAGADPEGGANVGGSGNHENEPEGFQPLCHMSADQFPAYDVPAETWTEMPGWIGSWWNAYPYADGIGDPNFLYLMDDPTTPVNGPKVLRTAWNAGYAVPGTAPALFGCWDSPAPTQYSKVYLSWWQKLDGPTFQTHCVLTKWGFLGSGRSADEPASEIVFAMLADGTTKCDAASYTQLNTHLRMGLVTQGLDDNGWRADAVEGPPQLTVGVWHHIEILLETNEALPACPEAGPIGCLHEGADGKATFWVDGQLVFAPTGIPFRNERYQNKFFYWQWQPVFGGLGGTGPTQENYAKFSDIYLSGLP